MELSILMKTKRAQSALEYMMTYGWAILIIVIVAAVLYAMGVFTPGKSAGNTATGFSGLTVQAFAATTGGIKISFGNSLGNTIKISGVA